MTTLETAILQGDEIDQDLIWSLLKRKDEKFGILKKLKAMARALDIPEEDVLEEAFKDDQGRYLDSPNRDAIHKALLDWANKGH